MQCNTMRAVLCQTRVCLCALSTITAMQLKQSWCVYRSVCTVLQLAELGLLPEGDADPLVLADKLTQLAIDANDDEVR